MCGIAGIVRPTGGPIREEWTELLHRRIAYRGPDGEGTFADTSPHGANVRLLHTRLSIIDLETGHQPMVREGLSEDDARLAVVFNGCIYNHRDLRDELEAKGHRFVTDHSDTEVLLHGFSEWRRDLPEHLEGMYAFAIWDRAEGALFLARDPFGEKPLYVRRDDDFDEHGALIAFSSDARSLGLLGSAGVLPNAQASAASTEQFTRRYLQLGYNDAGRTIYGGFGQPPGVVAASLTIRAGGLNTFATANARDVPDTGTPPLPSPPQELEDAIETRLEEAIRRRLEADVPLGSFLSGGIDSALIVALAKRHHQDLRSFCVRMPDPRFDESEAAARTAKHLGVDHTTLDVDVEPAEDLKRLIALYGQPFGDSSILPTYWVSKAARRHVKVALSGDGGDELFIGYERFLAARWVQRFGRFAALLPRQLAYRGHPKSLRVKLARLGQMTRDFRRLGVLSLGSIFPEPWIHQLLPNATATPKTLPPGDDGLATLRLADLTNYLPDDLLRKSDTASMANTLEVRAPFLDRDLAAAVLSLPPKTLLRGGRKGLLRSVAARHLPPEITQRPKMGFGIPIGEWFRTDFGGLRELLEGTLRSPAPFGDLPISTAATRRLVDQHLAGHYDHGQRLFALLTLALWCQLDGTS